MTGLMISQNFPRSACSSDGRPTADRCIRDENPIENVRISRARVRALGETGLGNLTNADIFPRVREPRRFTHLKKRELRRSWRLKKEPVFGSTAPAGLNSRICAPKKGARGFTRLKKERLFQTLLAHIAGPDSAFVDISPWLPSQYRPRHWHLQVLWRAFRFRLALRTLTIDQIPSDPSVLVGNADDLSELHRYYDRALGRPPGETAARAARR